MSNFSARGVDVSHHQEDKVDWAKVKAAGAGFVMVRAGYGSTKDRCFDGFVEAALAAGLHVGTYWASYALSVADAVAEADYYAKVLAPYKGRLCYPACHDYEYFSDDYARSRGVTITKELRTDMAAAFLRRMEGHGWYAMLYTNKDYWDNYYLADRLTAWDVWYSRPGLAAPDRACGIWQDEIGSTGGRWPGIAGGAAGKADSNTAYKDYAQIIPAAGLNGYAKAASGSSPAPAPAPQPKPQPGEIGAGSTVQIVGAAKYGGVAPTRGKKVPAAQKAPKRHTVVEIATHKGVKEARLKEINSWVPVASLEIIG